jgi:hypothetical protein
MSRASTWVLIPAENQRLNLTGNAHSGWYRKPGHIRMTSYNINRILPIKPLSPPTTALNSLTRLYL